MFPKGISSVIARNIITDDIVNLVVKVARDEYSSISQSSHVVKRSGDLDTFRCVFDFVRNVPYQMDGSDQVVSPPYYSFYRYVFENFPQDCKNRSILVCSFLKCLGYQTGLRFCGFNGNYLSHVYSFVVGKDRKTYFIDTCLDAAFVVPDNITSVKDYWV
jgi:hypothetical protein